MASDQAWQEQAACRAIPVELFFPMVEQESDEAKAVCSACTVREPCLESAITAGERFGVWGGLTPPERRSIVAKRRARARAAAAALEISELGV
jgi:WhiB family redox-sensing transcriptional regulator